MHANDYTSESMNSSSKFMVGLACGTVIGAAVGVLLATKSGAELRGQIADSARRFGKRMSETYGTVNEAVSSAVNTGHDAVRAARDSFSSAREKFATASESATEMGRNDV